MTAAKLSLTDILAKHQDGFLDRTADRERYQHALTELYKTIRVWLADPIAHGLAKVRSDEQVTLADGGVDPYRPSILRIDVGPRRIRYVPAGFAVVGAQGRVDVDAGDRSALLLLRDGAWYFVRRPPGASSATYTAFDESSFTDSVAELLGE